MKQPITSVLALSLAVATAGATAAFALASDGADGSSTRHSYVVGGELVQPRFADAGSTPTPAASSGRADSSTRYGYVVGGDLIVPER